MLRFKATICYLHYCKPEARSAALLATFSISPLSYTEYILYILFLLFLLFLLSPLSLLSYPQCTKVREGDDQQLRISPYTAASFARLICHSLRFLKLDRPHVLKVGSVRFVVCIRVYCARMCDAPQVSVHICLFPFLSSLSCSLLIA